MVLGVCALRIMLPLMTPRVVAVAKSLQSMPGESVRRPTSWMKFPVEGRADLARGPAPVARDPRLARPRGGAPRRGARRGCGRPSTESNLSSRNSPPRRAVPFRERLAPVLGAKPREAITDSDIQVLKAKRADKSPKTTNNLLAALGSMLRRAAEWGVIQRVPRVRLLQVPPATPPLL